MTNVFNDVHEFMTRMGKVIPVAPHWQEINAAQLHLAIELVHEEIHRELQEALNQGNMIKIFDGILDGIYVLAFLGHTLGLPLEEGWFEVQRTNLAKLHERACCQDANCPKCHGQGRYLEPVFDRNGKVTKPDGWTPPRLAELLTLALGRYAPR